MVRKYFFKTVLSLFKARIVLVFFGLFLSFNQSLAQWSSLGGGANDIVYAACPDVAGTGIYCCINFGNVSATKNWIQSSTGSSTPANLNANAYVNDYMYAIATNGTKIYVGGAFTTAQGAGAYGGIAVWNTSTNTWSNLGTGAAGSNKTIYAIAMDATNNLMYVGGEFTSISGVAANNVAVYNFVTSTWSALGSGATGLPAGSPAGTTVGVYALTVCNGNLYAGGRFTTMNGAAANSVAMWNGTTWSTLSGGGQIGVSNTTVVNPANIASAVWDAPVMALTNDGTKVYVGGDFNKVNNATGCNNIAAWNTSTSTWSTLGNGMTWPALGTTATDNTFGDQANIYCLTMYNGNLIAGGDFMKAGTVGGANTDLFVAQWNGSSWSAMTNTCGGHIESDVFCFAVSNNVLYAGGQFPEDVPNTPTGLWYIAKYTGAGPVMTVNVGTGTTICSTNSVALSASGATTYTWTNSTGLSCTVCSNPTASPTTTTVYTVTGTSSGCNSSKTVTVTVVATPTLTVNSPSICNGSSVILTASSASNYSWNTGATTNTISVSPGVGTTIYTVTGDNGSGCTATKTATVTVSAQPTLTINGATTNCSGNALVLTGSTTAGTYTWSANAGGTSTSTVSVNPPAGSITYTLNGSNGACATNTTITVSVTATPTVSVNNPSICSGTSTVLTASGASTFTWNTSATTNTISVSPGSTTVYTVTGDNGGGCTSVKTATVTVASQPTVSIVGATTHCSGSAMTLTGTTTSGTFTWSANAGSVSTNTVSVNPGLGNTTYTLNGSVGTCTATTSITVSVTATPTITVNSPTICSGQSTVLTAGGASTFTWSANAGGVTTSTVNVNPTTTTVYTVAGTSGACKDSITATVNVSPSPTLTLPASSYTVCLGNSVTLGVNGATTYTWTSGTGLSCTVCQNPVSTPTTATIYTVTGTSGSCSSVATVTVSINVNPLPTLTLTPSSNSICSSNSSTITASGASTYTWAPGGSLSGTSGSTVTATPVSTTDYTVSGTDGNGCMNTSVVTITVSPTPTINITPVPSAACSGQSVVLNGGSATTYTWSSNAGGANTATVIVTPSETVTYTLTGTTGSCTASAVATVTVNPLPIIGASTVVPAACGQSNGCIDTVLVSNGTPGYQYSWDHGATWSNAAQHCNIPTGSYEVIVKDQNGCLDSTSVAVSNLSGPPTPSVAAVATSVCLGANDSLSIVAPVGSYTYTWTDATGTHTGTSYTITNITPAGNYNVSVSATDINGCVAVTNTTIVVNSVPTTSVSGTDHFCKGTSTTLSATPNGGGYTYQWSQGGTPIGGATSSTYSANAAGIYNVQVTDNTTGCKANALADYTVTVDSLPKIDTTSMVINPSTCGGFSGSVSNVSVTPSGGTTYSWTDATGAVVGTSLNLSGVPAGNYCIHATTNPENCKDSLCSITVTNPNAPPLPVLTTTNNSYCQGQTQNPIVVTGSVTLTWYSDATTLNPIATGTTYTPNVVATTTVYVSSNSGGCPGPVLPVVITINPNPSTPLVSNPDSTYCQSQTILPITASSTPGSPIINWSTSPSMTPIVNTGTVYTPSGIAAGTTTVYYVQAVSAAGCLSSGTATTSVTVFANPADPTVSATGTTVCQGNPVGSYTASSTPGGTLIWSSSPTMSPVIFTGPVFTPSASVGTNVYYVQDTSAQGCASLGIDSITITVNPTPADPIVSATGTNVCNGTPIGTFTASSTSGGTMIWSTSPTMSPIVYTGAVLTPTNAVGTITYYVQDTSSAGCASNGIDSLVVTVNQPPVVSGGTLNTATCGNLNGGVGSLTVSPVETYTYTWTDQSTGVVVGDSLQLSGVGPGNYSLSVTDVNGCIATGTLPFYTVPAIATPTLNITPAFTQGTSPVSVTFNANASVDVTTYNWTMGDGTTSNLPGPSNTYTAAGTYTVILTADNGTCAARDTAIVVVDAAVSIVIPNIYSPNGDGINDEFFITCVGIKELHCDIFNRWGQLVYQMLSVDDKWDGVIINGNDATDGTYFYILDATGYDGKKYKANGSLTLVR
ncbi:MAG: Ig-like domain-containing protein [Bacteroidia bacterium]